MIIEQINGMTILYAENENKLTNKDRTFFANMIYLGINDNIENYSEVDKAIWKNYIDNLNDNDKDVINAKIEESITNQSMLEECLLDTDYRLLQLEIQLEIID